MCKIEQCQTGAERPCEKLLSRVRNSRLALPVNSSRARFGVDSIFPITALPEMSRALAQSGIEKWTVDTGKMTMTFYDKADREMLVEQIK